MGTFSVLDIHSYRCTFPFKIRLTDRWDKPAKQNMLNLIVFENVILFREFMTYVLNILIYAFARWLGYDDQTFFLHAISQVFLYHGFPFRSPND